MKTYTYEFATESTEIEISEEWMKVLEDLDRELYNNNQTESRRHTSYSCGDDGEWLATEDEDGLIDKVEAGRLLETAKECLSEKQLEVFIAIAAKGHSFSSYARETGMTKQFVRKLYDKAVRNLKKKTKTAE